jgi:ubiquinone/menaquinone biosynthesis C-methylase UbiE
VGFIGLDVRPTLQTDYVCSLQEAHNIFPYGTVDEIYCRRCLQHIPDDVAALKEIVMLLKEGGSATIIVSGWRAWLYYHLWWKHTHVNIYPCFHLYTKKRILNRVKSLPLADYLLINSTVYSTTEDCRQHSFDVVLKLFKRRSE